MNASGETVPWPLVFMLAIMGLSVLVVSTVLDTQHRRAHLMILTALALLVSLTLALVVSLELPVRRDTADQRRATPQLLGVPGGALTPGAR